MSGTWVLVADRARARLFEWHAEAPDPSRPPAPALVEIGDFADPEGRMRPRELESDRPQTTHDRFGAGRHAIEPHTPPEDKERARFARTLCEALEQGRTAHRFDALLVVAPPRFLGALNAAMPPPLRQCVAGELARELVDADETTLIEALDRWHP